VPSSDRYNKLLSCGVRVLVCLETQQAGQQALSGLSVITSSSATPKKHNEIGTLT
jgi:hypothetical protein